MTGTPAGVQDPVAPDSVARDPVATTRDAFYDGRLLLEQPARGHRSGTDAVLLAAAVPGDLSGTIVDVGSGVGAAGLGIALASPRARITLIERDAQTAGLAAANIEANGLSDRVSVSLADVLDRGARAAMAGAADLVVTNPPFYDGAAARLSPDPRRRMAHALSETASLADWLRACLDLLAAKGTLVMIHVPAALPEILDALRARAGGIVVKPVHAHRDQPARRILVRAVKDSRAPLALAPPLVLHVGDRFTPEADALHRGRHPLAW